MIAFWFLGSMIDTVLMYQLLKAVPVDTTLIVVGDARTVFSR